MKIKKAKAIFLLRNVAKFYLFNRRVVVHNDPRSFRLNFSILLVKLLSSTFRKR